MCCNVLQYVAVCCSVLQCVAVFCNVLQRATMAFCVSFSTCSMALWQNFSKFSSVVNLHGKLSSALTFRILLCSGGLEMSHCKNALQHTATTHCNTLQQRTATRCKNALQHTATTLCNTLQQRTATRSNNALQNTATHSSNAPQRTATHCNSLQHTATHCNTLQHTATHLIVGHFAQSSARDVGLVLQCVAVRCCSVL